MNSEAGEVYIREAGAKTRIKDIEHIEEQIENAPAYDAAAITIQKYVRAWFARSFVREAISDKKELSATAIQRIFRGRQGRLRAGYIAETEYVPRNRGAVGVQRIFRGSRGRKYARGQARKRKAAIDVQRIARGVKGRKRAQDKRECQAVTK